jgi:hypothetical protein
MRSRSEKLGLGDTSRVKGLACRPFRGQRTTPHNGAPRIIRIGLTRYAGVVPLRQ